MSDTINRTAMLARLDKKDAIQKALKTSEECGELAQAVLSASRAPTCEYKGLTPQDVLEESVDTATCALSVAVMFGFSAEQIREAWNKKLDAWERKIKEAEEKAVLDQTALEITRHFNNEKKDV